MLDLKKLTIEDIEIIRSYFRYTRSNVSDNTVGVALTWSDYFDTKYVVFEETLIMCLNLENVGECFLVPIGKNVESALVEIENYSSSKNQKLIFVDVTENDLPILKKRYNIEPELVEDWADYVYNASDLKTFAGKKYHGQKNHLNYFKKTYTNYRIVDINDCNLNEIEKFFLEFENQNEAGSKFYDEELKQTKWVIENNDILKFKGVVLYVDDKIVGITLSEIVNDTLFVHIEKADKFYRGAYQMLVSEFAKMQDDNIKYINREDSAGDEGLKMSKMQYHPCYLLNKYIVRIKN